MNLGARNEHAPKAGKLSEHFTANESADRFFANAQFSSAALHIQGLAFSCWKRIHDEATHYNLSRLLWCKTYTGTYLRCGADSDANRSALGGAWAVILVCVAL